jgi:hypothetical protein
MFSAHLAKERPNNDSSLRGPPSRRRAKGLAEGHQATVPIEGARDRAWYYFCWHS